MYYIYDRTGVITSAQNETPTVDNYCISDTIFDLDIYTITVEAVDSNKNLTHYRKKAKPAETLALSMKKIKDDLLNTQLTIALLESIADYNQGVAK